MTRFDYFKSKEKEYNIVLQERDRGKYYYEMKLVLVGMYEQDLQDVIEYCNTLTVAQMKYYGIIYTENKKGGTIRLLFYTL